MTTDDLALGLVAYYKGAYSVERVDQLKRFCKNVSEDDTQQLYDSITEERTVNTAIGVADIKIACNRIGISYRQSFYLADEKVECDCCGEHFKYSPAPTDEQEEQFGTHCRCPKCGFQYAWTLQARAAQEAGMLTKWYEDYKDLFSNPAYCRTAGWWYDATRNKKAVDKHTSDMARAKIEEIRNMMHVEAKPNREWSEL